MDSRSRRLPFCLSGSRSSGTASTPIASSSSSSSSSSLLGSSRLYGRETTLLSNERFPRAATPYKSELDKQSSRFLSPSRDYSSSDSRSASWKLPSLASSGRSYERPWESNISSRSSKLVDSESRLGMRSGLLNLADDGESKRAKLSYSNRGLYSRASPLAGSTYCSNVLSSSRAPDEKQQDLYDSSWRSCRFLSRSSASPSSSSSSSKPLLSRTETEPKRDPVLTGLGERRVRTPGVASSLYQTDRVTSTYAQGARPKDTAYSSSSSSSSFSSPAAREPSLSRHLSSSSSSSSSLRTPPPLLRDYSSRTPPHFLTSASRSSDPAPSPSSSYCSSPSSWQSSAPSRPESRLPPRPSAEGAEPEGRLSTRRLLSRLFSRRSSHESSSGASSVRSLDDDSSSSYSSSSPGGESADSDDGGPKTSGGDSDGGGSEATRGNLRNHRANLTPIQEGSDVYGGGAARMTSWRESGVSGNRGNSSTAGSSASSSWLSSSLRGRCPPLLSRLRRHARYEGGNRWDDLELKTSQDEEEEEDDEDEDEEEEEGAVGLDAFGAARPRGLDEDLLPELEDSSVDLSPRHRLRLYQNLPAGRGLEVGAEPQLEDLKESSVSSRDQEKLRKIKERLLLEDSDEEEGDLCRICQMGASSPSNPLIQPCRCTGSLQFVHQDCIKRWLRSKIGSGTNLEAITTCELCKEKLRLNIDNFDIQELYRTHVQSEYDEFISSGLYLVVLLHFCEQRFSDVLGAVDAAGLFNLVRILHEHMDNLESPHGESDEEGRDPRPSVDFSDLDDDLEDEY